MANEWTQGIYEVQNIKKYIGTRELENGKLSKNNPIYRSSWEKRVMYFCDVNPNIVRWGSELVMIPYYFSIDNSYHRYYTDIYAEIIDKDTKNVKKYVFEIKPKKQTTKPKKPKRKTAKSWRNYQNSLLLFEKNCAKWNAAQEFCNKKGLIFKKLTEEDIFTLT